MRRAAGAYFAMQVVGALSTFTLVILCARGLPREGFGTYITGLAIATVAATLLDFGLTPATSRALARTSTDIHGRLIVVALRHKFAATLWALGAAGILASIAEVNGWNGVSAFTVGVAAVFVGQTALYFVLGLAPGLGAARVNIVATSWRVGLELPLTVAAVIATDSPALALGVRGIASIGAATIGKRCALRQVVKDTNPSSVPHLRGDAIRLGAIEAQYAIFSQTDTLLCSLIAGTGQVALLAGPLRLLVPLTYPGLALAQSTARWLSEDIGLSARSQRVFGTAAGLSAVGGGVAVLAGVFGAKLIETILGDDFRDVHDVVLALTPVTVLAATTAYVTTICTYIGSLTLRLAVGALALVIDVLCGLAFIPRWEAVGAAAAASIALTVYCLGHVWILSRALGRPEVSRRGELPKAVT